MICGRILNLQIENKEDHLATTWVIARDPYFKDIIFTSEDDTKNLETITIDISLEKGAKYYGRARPRTRKGGWCDWQNMEIFTPRYFDSADTKYKVPSRIGAPRISSMSDNRVCNQSEHPITNFILKATGYAVIGGNKHKKTSWYIEDIDRNVIWKKENIPYVVCTSKDCFPNHVATNDRHACVRVDDIILEMNKCYRARCVFFNETNDVSDISSYTFITMKEKNPALKAYLTRELIDNRPKDLSQDIVLEIPMDSYPVQDPTTEEALVEIEIFEVESATKVKRFSGSATSNSPFITIEGNILNTDKVYILKYRSSTRERDFTLNYQWLGDEWEAIYFSTF